jgi:hypothetical protein
MTTTNVPSSPLAKNQTAAPTTASDAVPPGARSWLPPKRFFFIFVGVHAAISIALFFLDFQLGMARFDSGLPASGVERIVSGASTVLLSPLFIAAVRSATIAALLPGRLGWAPLLANSALWAAASWWCIVAVSWLRKSQSRDRAQND